MAPTRGRQWLSLGAVLGSLFSLLPLEAAADKTAADYFVNHLPGAPEPLLKQYAGHIEIVPEHHGNLFFWFYENKHIANRQRTVIWLNGGPGCSSMDGALMEIGPYRVAEGGTLTYNNGSWNEFSNLLFVDNPVGTGFSYVDSDSYIHELDEMASNMISFLEEWFALFPEYAQDDIYIAGESYAGQHIPYIARAMLDRNQNKAADQKWNLQGLLIGNGWISGPEQYLSYLQFAYQAGLVQGGSEAAQKIEATQANCVKDLERGSSDRVDVPSCEAILSEILRVTMDSGDHTCHNMYDVRLRDTYPSCGMNWPPDLEYVTPYLRRNDVKQALHINPDKMTGWTECSGAVSGAFTARNSKASVKLLPGLLQEMPIILFSGDQDLICNHIGTEDLISNLEWNGGTGFQTSSGDVEPQHDWSFEGEPAGIYQSARNLTYIKFFDSSHMVPFDYPRRTRDMLDRFVGVDVTVIGGKPVDSKIDGVDSKPMTGGSEKDPSSPLSQEDSDKLSEATWQAYKRSGEVALVVICIIVGAWGFFVWRDRRKRRGYAGVSGDDPSEGPTGGFGLGRYMDKRKKDRDVEAARAYDEAELDDLTGSEEARRTKSLERDNFELHDSEDEAEPSKPSNGHAH